MSAGDARLKKISLQLKEAKAYALSTAPEDRVIASGTYKLHNRDILVGYPKLKWYPSFCFHDIFCQEPEKPKDLASLAAALKQAVENAKKAPEEKGNHVLPAYVSGWQFMHV